MRVLLYALVGTALWTTSAWAQTGAVVEHYRAYREALDRGDLVAAETAATAAVSASEARDGDGGRTAVLLLNLAQLRLEAGRPADALAPAQRTLAIVEARGAEAGVDPLLARLVLGRAELSQRGDAGLQRLRPAIDEALATEPLRWEAYTAAKALAEWAMRENRFAVARDVWTSAIAAAEGEEPIAVAARATGLLGRGAALTLMDEVSYEGQARASLFIQDRPDARAHADFVEALRTIWPLAIRRVGDASLTEAQLIYAQAFAWTRALHARLTSLGWEPPSEGEEFGGLRFDLNLDDGARVCRMRIDPDPMPTYPEDVLERYGVGAVVVRIVTDSEGAIIDIQPVATVGGAAFEQSVRAVANRWRLVPGASYSEPCTREAVMFLPITFRVGR